MNKRLETLSKIDELEAKHCKGCKLITRKGKVDSYCVTRCKIGAELKQLGNQLLGSRDEKIKETLKKGKDITTNDVVYLVNNGVSRKKIIRELKINSNEGVSLIKEILNNSTTSDMNLITDTDEMNMKSSNFKKAVQLHEKGIKNTEISKELGIKKSTVSNYLNINKKFKRVKKLNEEKVVSEKLTNKNNETRMEKVINLTNQKVPTKEIAEKLGIKTEAVYQDRYRYKQEQEGKSKSTDEKTINDKESEKPNYKYKEFETELVDLKKEVLKLQTENTELIKENQEIISKTSVSQKNVEEAYQELQIRNDELIKESEEIIESLEADLETEISKHEALFKYITS